MIKDTGQMNKLPCAFLDYKDEYKGLRKTHNNVFLETWEH